MKKKLKFLLLFVVLSAITPAIVLAEETELTASDYIQRLIWYHANGYSADVERTLVELEEFSNNNGTTDYDQWNMIMDYWQGVDNDDSAQYTESYDIDNNGANIPEGLPDDDSLCVVVLGYALNDDGSMQDELKGRCDAAVQLALKYPNAYIACTGGGTAKDAPDVTEAEAMKAYIIENYGDVIDVSKIIVETEAKSTVENAENTYDLLCSDYPEVEHLVMVTSQYHLKRGSVLYNTVLVMKAFETGNTLIDIVGTYGWYREDKTSEGLSMEAMCVAQIAGIRIGRNSLDISSAGPFTITGDIDIGEEKNVSVVNIYGESAALDVNGDTTVSSNGVINGYDGADFHVNDSRTLTVKDGGSIQGIDCLTTDNGIIIISNGGTVQNTNGYIGYIFGSSGTATVTGSGSEWINSSNLVVGYYGSGEMNISDGGFVKSDCGYIGLSSFSSGKVTVDSSESLWSNSDALYVGYEGAGELNITDGGVVKNTIGYIGYYPNGTGTVNVDGGTWDNSGDLYVGYEGIGLMTVANGGTVKSVNSTIGANSSSTGLVTVTGTDSVWENSGNMDVGIACSGEIVVSDNGLINVGGAMNLGYDSITSLKTGGKIHAASASISSGATLNFELNNSYGNDYMMEVDGTFKNNGGTVKVTSNGTLSKYQRYNLIKAGNITTPFDADMSGVSSDMFIFGVESTVTNLSVVVTDVIDQPNPSASVAKASFASSGFVMQNTSANIAVSRGMLRQKPSGEKIPSGSADPSVKATDDVTSGEWVAYLHNFNDIGGVDDGDDTSDWESHGYLVGGEKSIDDCFLIGFGAGQSWIDIDTSEEGCSGKTRSEIATVYSSWFNQKSYVDVGAFAAFGKNKAYRRDTAHDYYTGEYDSEYYGAWVESGHIVFGRNKVTIEPYLRADYIYGEQDEYTDEGGDYPMTVYENDNDSLQIEGGIRFGKEYAFENDMKLLLKLKTGVQCELLNDTITVDTLIAGDNQQVTSPETDRAALVLGASAEWKIIDNLYFEASYEPTFSGNWHNHSIDFVLKYNF